MPTQHSHMRVPGLQSVASGSRIAGPRAVPALRVVRTGGLLHQYLQVNRSLQCLWMRVALPHCPTLCRQ